MRKYRSRWSYDPQEKYRKNDGLPSFSVGIIIQGVIGFILVWGWLVVMLQAF
jgi:hypothetical protein